MKTMKYSMGIVLTLLTLQTFSQSNLKIKQDSIKIQRAELVIENQSRDVKGILQNMGGGRTEFRMLQLENLGDTAIAIKGQDTMAFKGSGSNTIQSPVPFSLSVQAINSTQQRLKWWKSPQDLYVLPKVGVIGGSQGKGAFTSTYRNSIIGRVTTYLEQVASSPVVTNYCQNGYNTRQLLPNGSNQWVDANNNITKALADGNKIIILVTPSNDADPNNPSGGATPLTETMANIAAIEDACVKSGAVLFVFSGFPRHDFAQTAPRVQQLDLSQLLLKQFGSRCAYVYKLLEDPANPYRINPVLHTGDGAHLNDQGALIAYIPMRDVLVGYYTSNTQVSGYEVQRAGSLNGGFVNFQTVNTPDGNSLNLAVDNAFYRVRFRQYDGRYSDWSNIVQGIGTVTGTYPIVNVGPDKVITLPNTLELTASASDPVGTITSYQWTKLEGGGGAFLSPASSSTVVQNLIPGPYIFRCTVTNNSGLQASDDVNVTVNRSPVNSRTARFNFSLTSKPVASYTNLFGNPHIAVLTGTDPVTGIGLNTVATSAWSTSTGATALDNMAVVNDGGNYAVDQAVLANVFYTGHHSAITNFNITGLTPGKLCKILVIGNAVSSPRVTKVVVNGQTQQYNATQNSSKAAIFDQVPVPSGGTVDIAAYANDQDATPFGVISAIVVEELEGDGEPLNQFPTVNAGYDQTVSLPANPILTATASDPDGTVDTYLWTKISGGNASINSPNAASTIISGLSSGTYVFRCTVTDNKGGTAFDDVQIIATSPSTTRTGSFNFSYTSNPVSGFVNVTGYPHLGVCSGTSASGIGINTIAASAYAPNGAISALSGVSVTTDDGQGFVVPVDAFRGVMFTVAYSPVENLEVTGLTPGKYCKILFTANATSSPRNNMVRVNGQVKQFNATQNRRNAAIFDFVLVPADGKVRIAFYAENTTSYAGLVSAVVVDEY